MRKWFRFGIIAGLFSGISIIVLTLAVNWWVEQESRDHLFNSAIEINSNKVGLLLGTSKRLRGGRSNLYFKYRIDAAAELYFAGKIQYILVSGDNGSDYYNEPMDMKKALIQKGVPEDRIILDYAGFRTLDSIIRSKEVFGLDSVTVISQAFHNERAIYIARNKGINAIAMNAKDVNLYNGFKTRIREYLARVKMMLDLYITNTEARYLGEKIQIGE